MPASVHPPVHSRGPRRRRALRAVLAATAVVALSLSGAITASAATTVTWASWQPLAGSANAYTTAISFVDRPALSATVTSDSRAGQVGVISGESAWLSEGTPVGAKYGSSRNSPYLNLRPKADRATTPSTTTYTFDRPTPASGWAFTLGDIDADAVRLSGVTAGGTALTAADLGFQGGFNYCAPGIAGKPSCTGDVADVPSWDADALTLTGNAAAIDTSGAAAWFEPTVALSSLTVEFTRRSGFPVYQTWFSVLARDITGTVQTDGTGEPVADATVTLIDPNGLALATTTSDADGGYSFLGQIAADGYTVEVTAPVGQIAVIGSGTADLSTADATVPLTVRDIVPVAVSGTVRDENGTPVAGVAVTIPTDDGDLTAVTSRDGTYLFDAVPVGTWQPVIAAPAGYTVQTSPPAVTIELGDTEGIENVDAVIDADPTLSGRVILDGAGVAGVIVNLDGPAGALSAVTDADGRYSFPRVPSGTHEIRIDEQDVPTGTYLYTTLRREVVQEDDVVNADFALGRFGTVLGSVRDEAGTPLEGVTLTVIPTVDEPFDLTTDAEGAYSGSGLRTGTYTVAVAAPDGYSIVGAATITVTVTDAGEIFADRDFVLAVDPDEGENPIPSPSPSAGGGADGPDDGTGSDDLASSGGAAPVALIGIGVAALALGAALVIRRIARSRRNIS